VAKAKKLTKKGRPRTGTRPGSGKKRGDVRAGARPANRQRARVKRTAKKGVSRATGVAKGPRTRPPRRKTAKNVRNRASSVAKAEAAGRMGGPSIPLRDLIRGGMPRSPKARGGIAGAVGIGGPQIRRRMSTAHGWRAASGTSMMQYQPGPLEHVGTQRAPIRKG
jgi:hypothetical protein